MPGPRGRGRSVARPTAHPRPLPESQLDRYLEVCRRLVLDEIRTIVPRDARCGPILYDLMLDYPLRSAKAVRPALCIATCRALGGRLESVLRSAAVLEFYHNAFLIHDDVEDGSQKRRDLPTLHAEHGVPIAINVGDAMLALALQPLLDNMRSLGLGKALRILQIVGRMARETAEGQAIELTWIRRGRWELSDGDYVRMVRKKTSWYTFVAPMLIGAVVAGAAARRLPPLRRFAASLGTAFQIQDDILNLTASEALYGKEIGGDLWEGKHTLILLHAMRRATRAERPRARRILGRRRPAVGSRDGRSAARLVRLVADLHARGQLSASGKEALARALQALRATDVGEVKTSADVRFLRALIERHHSIDHARRLAWRWAGRAKRDFARVSEWVPPSVHREFLHGLIDFVVSRAR